MKNKVILFLLSINSVFAVTYFFYSDTIEDGDAYGDTYVYCIDDITTIIDMYGGTIDAATLYDLSEFNLYGGSCYSLTLREDSQARIYGGNMSYCYTYDNSISEIYDLALDEIVTYNNSQLNIYGADANSLNVTNSSLVIINDGTFDYINLYTNSPIHLKKVNVLSNIIQYSGNSEIHIYGNNFNYTSSNTQLSGEWYDGTPFLITFGGTQFSFDSLILHYPEPIICTSSLAADLNGDCKVDLNDFYLLVQDWLECNRAPQSACWE